MDLPAYFPDLNPIEHVWDALGRRIAASLHHPENTQQLKQMLIEEWALLPQEMLHQLVLSMRRRCEATIAHIKILSEKQQILEVARNIVRKQHLDLNDEEKKERGVLDITVSFDGSWQKRSYKSLYGIEVVIDLLRGLVIDYEILSKYCT
ncbi:transposable element Tcb2 transposase [Trichonephila clavipes]|nr:transposable element Tcb2 transposase [Trichonephila clavipes]